MGGRRQRRRKAKAAGRGRIRRIHRDHLNGLITEDQMVANTMLALSRTPGRSLVPSDWDRVIGEVQRYRETYKHLSQLPIHRWYKQAIARAMHDTVIIDGTEISLKALRKVSREVWPDATDKAREEQLAFLAGCCVGETWQMVLDI